MQSGPYKPFRPGQLASARKLTDIAEEAYAAGRTSADAGTDAIRTPTGVILAATTLAPIWMRVTGKERIYPGGTDPIPANCYSGAEILTDADGTIIDYPKGIRCYADSAPLVDLSGDDSSVATDTPVRAYVAPQGDHLTFVPGGGGACGDPGPAPTDWTVEGPRCYQDFIEEVCSNAATFYRRVRLFLTPGGFVTWTGPLTSTYPPPEP